MTKEKKMKIHEVSGCEEAVLEASSNNLQKPLISYEERLNYVNEIAQPMAGRKLTKKIFKLIKKVAKIRECCRAGLKAVQTSLRKGATGLVVIAGDVSPVDVIVHLPGVCEDKEIPYCYVPSKDDIGTAMGVVRGVIALLIIDHPDIHDLYSEVVAEVKALPLPF